MNTGQLIALAVVAYLLLRNSGTDLFGGMFSAPKSPSPVPVPSPGPQPGAPSAAAAATPGGLPASTLAQLLVQAANQSGVTGDASSIHFSVWQWNYFIDNSPVLQAAFGVHSPVTDLSEVGIHVDAAGQTPTMSAYEYVALRQQSKGLSGLEMWAHQTGMGNSRVIDMRRHPQSKWTM